MQGTSSVFFLLIIVKGISFSSASQENGKPDIGIIYSIEKDKILYEAGYRYIEESAQRRFSPRSVTEEKFQQDLPALRNTQCRVVACNLFVPGHIKLIGPDMDEKVVLGYVDTVARRCNEAGVEVIVLGSGQARKLPNGYDYTKAKSEFIALARKMAAVAQQHNIVIAIENLNRSEVNFVNTLAEALEIVRAVDHPNFRLTADIYHMLKEDEPPAAIEAAGNLLVHCHIAEEQERAYPGKRGEEFRPYFRALKKIKFTGKITMECGWKNIDAECGPALKYLQQQLDEVFDQ